MPGYGKCSTTMSIEQYIGMILNGTLFDPALSIHIKDGWSPIKPIYGYLQHDEDSAGWAEVMQWVNPYCPPPPEFELQKLTTNSLGAKQKTSSPASEASDDE